MLILSVTHIATKGASQLVPRATAAALGALVQCCAPSSIIILVTLTSYFSGIKANTLLEFQDKIYFVHEGKKFKESVHEREKVK